MEEGALTHDEEQIARADISILRLGGHGHGGSHKIGAGVGGMVALGRRDVHRGPW